MQMVVGCWNNIHQMDWFGPIRSAKKSYVVDLINLVIVDLWMIVFFTKASKAIVFRRNEKKKLIKLFFF